MSNQIEYSVREQTQKNHCVKNAVDAAETIMRVNKKFSGLDLSVLAKKKLKMTDKITIVELNQISDQILRDSGYYRR